MVRGTNENEANKGKAFVSRIVVVVVVLACFPKQTQILRKAFVGLLSSEDWAVSAAGVSSVAVFASDLDPSHQAMLPLCLPKVCMGLFQARASGTVSLNPYLAFTDLPQ